MPTATNQKLARGHVLDCGEAHALTSMDLFTSRASSIVTGMDLKASDVRDKIFHLHAFADVDAP